MVVLRRSSGMCGAKLFWIFLRSLTNDDSNLWAKVMVKVISDEDDRSDVISEIRMSTTLRAGGGEMREWRGRMQTLFRQL